MLTIRPTKMLARRLGLEVPATSPIVTNRVADWCAHDFQFGRHRYLMFCNTASLYPVVTFARGVTDGRTLVARLMEALQLNGKNKLLKSQYERRIAGEGAEVQWAPIPGRSLLGGMNELISASKYALADGDLTLEAMSP